MFLRLLHAFLSCRLSQLTALLCSLCMLFLAACAVQASGGAGTAGPEDSGPVRLRLAAGIDADMLPVLRMPIAGREESFVIDTGSDAGLHVTDAFRRRMGGQLVPEGVSRSRDLAGQVNEARTFRMAPVDIGGLRFPAARIVELKPWGLRLSGDAPSEPPERMVMGRGFLQGKALLLALRSGRAEIMEGGAARPHLDLAGWRRVAMVDSDEGPVIAVRSAERVLHLVVDTAATVPVVKRDSVSGLLEASCARLLDGLADDDCATAPLTVGPDGAALGFDAMVVDTDLGGFGADGVLGGSFLTTHDVLIDFQAEELYVSP